MAITIQVSDEVWGMLSKLRTKPSDTFDLIIRRLIANQIKKEDKKNDKAN